MFHDVNIFIILAAVAYPGVGVGGPRPDQLEIMTKIISKYNIIIVIYMKSKSKISQKILPLPFSE